MGIGMVGVGYCLGWQMGRGWVRVALAWVGVGSYKISVGRGWVGVGLPSVFCRAAQHRLSQLIITV